MFKATWEKLQGEKMRILIPFADKFKWLIQRPGGEISLLSLRTDNPQIHKYVMTSKRNRERGEE